MGTAVMAETRENAPSPGYAGTMGKREISLELDEDVAEALQNADEALLARVNQAVRRELERSARNENLKKFLAALDEEDGPVDRAEVEKFKELL